MRVNVNKLVPGIKPKEVEHNEGTVCGVFIIQCQKTKKIYVGYRTNLYAAIRTATSALRKGRHRNKLLQAAHDNGGLKYYTFPTDTVGEALDLRNNIIDEFSHKDIFLNIYGANYVTRVRKQVTKYSSSGSSGVMVDRILYDSRKAAALAYGLSVSTVAYRIKSPIYSNWSQF